MILGFEGNRAPVTDTQLCHTMKEAREHTYTSIIMKYSSFYSFQPFQPHVVQNQEQSQTGPAGGSSQALPQSQTVWTQILARPFVTVSSWSNEPPLTTRGSKLEQ